MERTAAAERVGYLRELLCTSEIDPTVHSDGTIFLIGGEGLDRFDSACEGDRQPIRSQ